VKSEENLTQLVQKLSTDEDLYDVVYSRVYSELKKMAGYRLSRERNNHTISKTELVHEVYIKMIDQTSIDYNDYSHFLAIASTCMRQLLIDYARKKNAKKRGDGVSELTFIDGIYNKYEQSSEDIINIDFALRKLEKLNKRLSEIVTMRFFGEMKIDQIAEVLDISESTVHRDWAKAKGFLYNELNHK
jgi:RNA polymerase sigma factor (TIGR02999 family)